MRSPRISGIGRVRHRLGPLDRGVASVAAPCPGTMAHETVGAHRTRGWWTWAYRSCRPRGGRLWSGWADGVVDEGGEGMPQFSWVGRAAPAHPAPAASGHPCPAWVLVVGRVLGLRTRYSEGFRRTAPEGSRRDGGSAPLRVDVDPSRRGVHNRRVLCSPQRRQRSTVRSLSLHVESTVREHLPLMLHRDVRMPRCRRHGKRLEAGATQRPAVGANLAGGGEFNYAGHRRCWVYLRVASRFSLISTLFKGGSVPFVPDSPTSTMRRAVFRQQVGLAQRPRSGWCPPTPAGSAVSPSEEKAAGRRPPTVCSADRRHAAGQQGRQRARELGDPTARRKCRRVNGQPHPEPVDGKPELAVARPAPPGQPRPGADRRHSGQHHPAPLHHGDQHPVGQGNAAPKST